jgi:hypothetical protein
LLDAQAEAARAAEKREERLRMREEARRITVSGMTGRLEEKI